VIDSGVGIDGGGDRFSAVSGCTSGGRGTFRPTTGE